MKANLMRTSKPAKCKTASGMGIEYLNALLKRIIRQKKYSQEAAPDQVYVWRKYELQVRKCIQLAQRFADEV